MQTPPDIYTISLAVHLTAGTFALVAFWTAALLRKGSPSHRLVGRCYLVAMVGVIVSGAPLAHALIARGQPVSALFLAYLLLLVAVSCWNAWRAVRDRAAPARYYGPMYWTLSALLLVSGSGVVMVGIEVGHPLLVVFGSVGVLSGLGAVRASRRPARDPRWWMREHYGAMIANGVATHIAFLGIGLGRLLPALDPQALQLLAWCGPLVVAVAATLWLNRRYGRGRTARAANRTGGAPSALTAG